jgi:hypothetical protein
LRYSLFPVIISLIRRINSLFGGPNSLIGWAGNLLRKHLIFAGFSVSRVPIQRPNLLNSLYFPSEQGIHPQRRVRARLAAQPTSRGTLRVAAAMPQKTAVRRVFGMEDRTGDGGVGTYSAATGEVSALTI